MDDLIDDASDREWYEVIAELYHRQVKLKAGLSGHSPEDELENALDFLESHQNQVSSSNRIQPIIELVLQNTSSVEDAKLERWISLCNNIASEKRANDRYQQEREFISLKIELKQVLDKSVESEQGEIIQSIEAETEFQGKRSNLLRATVLERGLDRCSEFLDDDKMEEWKREAKEARLQAAEDEMTEVPLDDELVEAVAEEAKENATRLVEWFETTVDLYESSTYALYCLLCSDGYVPSYEMAQNAEKGFVFREVFQTQYTSPEGHAIGINPPARDEEKDRIPSSYPRNIDTKNRTLAEALYRLIDRGSLTEFDFHIILSIAKISTHTYAFLTDAIIDLFEGNYVQSLAIAMPHFEGAIVDTLDNMSRPAVAKTEDGTQQQAFGGLLEDLEDDIEPEYLQYLKVNYTDGRGANQRNRWSHGQFKYFQANFRSAVIVLFDTLKTLIELNPTPYTAIFSLPSRTISTETRRQQGIDISEHLEEEQSVLAYAYAEDASLIIAEDENEGRTPFIVVRGGLKQDYGVSETDLSRDEIQDYVEGLKHPAPDLPEDIELTWLDTEAAVQAQIEQIISELDEKDGVPKEDVVATAQRFGLTDEQIKTAIDDLLENGKISGSDGDLFSN